MPCHNAFHSFVCLIFVNTGSEGSEKEDCCLVPVVDLSTSLTLLMLWVRPWLVMAIPFSSGCIPFVGHMSKSWSLALDDDVESGMFVGRVGDTAFVYGFFSNFSKHHVNLRICL